MFDQTLTIQNIFYLLFGFVGLASALFAIWRGVRQESSERSHRDKDEAIRIMRMDENIKQVTAGISDIKAEMRSTKKLLDNHEKRILKLELENDTQWKRIDELKEAGNERQAHQDPDA